jgi:tRNA (guanine37-N1)-methyltransferase
MHFDIVTIFPEFFSSPFAWGIVRRAHEAGLIHIRVHDLRDFTLDRHRTTDDRPFGGGEGMVMKCEPIVAAVEGILEALPTAERERTAVVLLSASGQLLNQAMAWRWSELERLVLLCGRYEGVDERIAEHVASEEVSVGNFVLSGGELPAAMVVDAVTRLLPGALGDQRSSERESFTPPTAAASKAGSPRTNAVRGSLGTRAAFECAGPGGGGIFDCPHYTRPAEFRGWVVPQVLLSGNHEEIRRWRRKQALEKTLRNRPDLLAAATLTEEDRQLLDEILAK